MGFLSPVFLVAGLAVAVPLILHLFHKHDARRLAFPALRYLLRTEKDHARTIRLRQLLLLLLRIAAVLLLVVAGARPFLRRGGGVHDPTAVVVILDNSMSAGLIRDGERVLELLKAVALKSVERAGDEDRVWLIRAGQPWDAAITGSRADLRAAILDTEVTGAAGDLVRTLDRAALLVSGTTLSASEIHLVSDLQASAFLTASTAGDLLPVPVVVFRERADPGDNGYLDNLVIGGGLSPLANQRTRLSVEVSGGADGVEVPLRLVIANRIRGAVTGVSGGSSVFGLGPFPPGRVTGYVETDPDDLRGDDRRYFTFRVRPPPTVATTGATSFFLSEALPVLTAAGRIRMTSARDAEVLVSTAGAGVTDRGRARRATVIVPSEDPALLPGLNRSLAAAGIPWRYEVAPEGGEASVTDWRGAVDLDEVRIRAHYVLRSGTEGVEEGVLARLSSGEPWVVEGESSRGPFLLLASALDEHSTNLAVTAAMVPMLEWMVSRWGVPESGSAGVVAGHGIPTPPGATAVRDPQGTLHPVDGTQPFRDTRWTGLYEIIQGDSVVDVVAVNAPSEESTLQAITTDRLEDLLPGPMTVVADSARWARALFSTGKGPEIWRWSLAAVVAVLLAESLVAASGPSTVSRDNAARVAPRKTPA